MDATQIVAVSLGGAFLLLLLGLVFWRRNLTAAEYTFARIVLALAVACVAVILTGYLTVEFKGYIQAGGALGVLVLVYLFKPAALQGSSEWQAIRLTWRELRDLPEEPANANQDDVVRAVNAVNKAARVIGEDDSLFRTFKADYGKDYATLYHKLVTIRYPLPHVTSTSDAQLTNEARRLAERLG